MHPDLNTYNTELLASFEKISLDRLEESGLFQNRIDRKFVLPVDEINELLSFCQTDYHVLEVGGKRTFEYVTDYYDTGRFDFYFQHHRGKPSRVKVRERTYLDSGIHFVEVKQKLPNGNTKKFRTKETSVTGSSEFVQAYSGYGASDLQNTLTTKYNRITLFHKTAVEKITIDYNLRFSGNPGNVEFPNILLLEIKTPGRTDGALIRWFREKGYREGSLSKYVLGMISINPGLKHNRFKKAYTRILNKNNNGHTRMAE